jgi:o-succinylbenzoate---CoA ligase
MKSYNNIIIQGVTYHSDNLRELFTVFGGDKNNGWLEDIVAFLTEWFADTTHIDVQSSGSTGIPKTIALSKYAMVQSAKATQVYLGLKKDDTALLCLPASYIAGKMMLVRAMVCGLNLYITRPSADPFLNLKLTIDFAAVSPFQLSHSLQTLKNRDVKKIIAGGGHVSSALEKEVQALDTAIYESYGMTETISHIALRKLNGTGSSGFFQVLPGIEIRKDSRECLVIKAPALFPGELITNDMVELHDPIQFRWLGRYDNVINSGGIKIFPETIERKLETIITSKYIISALPDDALGEKVVLVMEGFDPGEEEKERLRLSLTEVLDKYEVPREIRFISAFPVSITGKLNRKGFIRSLFPRN